jgi:hypothetical protein
MAHFAKLNDDNVVVFVTVGRDEDEHREEQLSAETGRTYKRTSFNTRAGVHYDPKTGEPSADQSKAFRGNYAGIGFTYDEGLDAFIPPKPSEDATLDEATFSWVVPEVDEA